MRLDKKGLVSILPKKLLTCRAVIAIAKIIPHPRKDIHVADTHQTVTIWGKRLTKPDFPVTSLNLCPFILMPLCLNCTRPDDVGHWIIVGLDNVDQSITIYDSIPAAYGTSKFAETVVAWLHQAIDEGLYCDSFYK